MPELTVALVSGPMYDALYRSLDQFERTTGIAVHVGFAGSHPDLNAHLAGLRDVPYDLVSTHTKYAPSQTSFLAPLDAIADRLSLDQFYPACVDLAKIGGRLYGVPRNIDVKLLHYRSDLLPAPPSTWEALLAAARAISDGSGFYGFVFPGMESGLFGTFFELAEAAGASVFPPTNLTELDNEGGRWALTLLRDLYQTGSVPREVVDWHFEEVHRCFRDGHAAMVCDWPGAYGSYSAPDSSIEGRFQLARMPVAPGGKHRAYAGSHTFALSQQGIGNPEAVELLRFLTAPEQQWLDARQGSVPVRPKLFAALAGEPGTAERWRLLELVIGNDMLIPPRLSYYPEIEEILWRTVRSAMTGEIGVSDALRTMEKRIRETHVRYSPLLTEHNASGR